MKITVRMTVEVRDLSSSEPHTVVTKAVTGHLTDSPAYFLSGLDQVVDGARFEVQKMFVGSLPEQSKEETTVSWK